MTAITRLPRSASSIRKFTGRNFSMTAMFVDTWSSGTMVVKLPLPARASGRRSWSARWRPTGAPQPTKSFMLLAARRPTRSAVTLVSPKALVSSDEYGILRNIEQEEGHDADRLKKYLAKFELKFEVLKA